MTSCKLIFKSHLLCLGVLVTFLCFGNLCNAQMDTLPIRIPPPDTLHTANQQNSLFRTKFAVRNITIEGNKTTSERLILREFPILNGDSIQIKDIPEKFEFGKQQLLNTRLFHEAVIAVDKFEDASLDIKIIVKERWYIFPLPYFKPVDRNLSQWLLKNKADFSRINYGIKLHHDNVTGNGDKLRLHLITGYTKQLSLIYSIPYVDKKMKWGLNVELHTGKTKEINDKTIDFKQQFIKSEDNINIFTTGGIQFTYKKAYLTKHKFGIGFSSLKVGDTVIKSNPKYFSTPTHKIFYPELHYTLIYQNLDYYPYPSKGNAFLLNFSKKGFTKEVNSWSISAIGMQVIPVAKRTFYTVVAGGVLKAPFKQPFVFADLIGYGDYNLRGYEYYVFDGDAGLTLTNSITRQLTNFKMHIPGTKWLTPRLIPLKIYGNAFVDMGYAHNPLLASKKNMFLISGGIGLDLFTMYDFTFKLNFSINHFGNSGLFLQKKTMFQ